jgi:hypothetical protein
MRSDPCLPASDEVVHISDTTAIRGSVKEHPMYTIPPSRSSLPHSRVMV